MSKPPTAAYSQDLLAREPFAQELERFLLAEHHFVEGSLVLSLHAPFGSGKSTFVQMWSNDLQARRKADPKLPRPVVLNAWESDYCGDPLIAILAALNRALLDPASPDRDECAANSLREAAKDVGWFAVGLANGVATKLTGLNAIAAGDFAEKKKSARDNDGENGSLLDTFEERRKALGRLKESLAAVFGAVEPRAIVFIDELDRCRPDYAIGYLETIKHIFDIHGIAFVLCVDEGQIQSAARVLFGADLQFAEYFRKFAHRTVKLPQPISADIERLALSYSSRYLEVEGKRWCVRAAGHDRGQVIAELIAAFKLAPRQIQEVYRVLGHALSCKQDSETKLKWAFNAGLIFMGALRVSDRGAYEDLGAGRYPIAKLPSLIAPLSKNQNSKEWWFKVLVAGFKYDDAWKNLAAEELIRQGLAPAMPAKKVEVTQILGEFIQGWGSDFGDTAGLTRVYERIEAIKSFGG
jgi:hypothetical protein